MSIDEIEAEALKLEPKACARLAERLLRSLEVLSDGENETLWRKRLNGATLTPMQRPALRDPRPTFCEMLGPS
jgi:hypothetical protein